MKEKEVTINGKPFKLKELSYLGSLDIEETKQNKGIKECIKLMFKHSGLSEEEINNLSVRDGLLIQKEINELNSLEDFQTPVK